MGDPERFIPHLQGCEAVVMAPDDNMVRCGAPAVASRKVVQCREGAAPILVYVCDHHRG